MDDQQNRRAESGLHAGTEPRNDCEGGDVGRVQGRRKRHLTAQIKPATRNAMLDQLAAIADGIIHERIAQEMAMDVMRARLRPPSPSKMAWAALQLTRDKEVQEYADAILRPWWRRLLGLR